MTTLNRRHLLATLGVGLMTAGGGDRTHRGGRRRRWWPTEHLPVKIGDAVGGG